VLKLGNVIASATGRSVDDAPPWRLTVWSESNESLATWTSADERRDTSVEESIWIAKHVPS